MKRTERFLHFDCRGMSVRSNLTDDLQAAVKRAPQAELSKAEKKRLRQERDPNFKGKPQGKKEGTMEGGQSSVPEQPGKPAPEPSKRKARGIGFDDTADRNKRQKADGPAAAQ